MTFAQRPGMHLNGALCTLLIVLLHLFQPDFFSFLDYRIYDRLLGAAGKPASGRVLIVDLDEETLSRYGQWPWPRYRVEDLLTRIGAMGPAAMGLDMVFAEKDRTSLTGVVEEMNARFGKGIVIENLPDALGDNDRILAAALTKGPFVLGCQFLFDGEGRGGSRAVLSPARVNVLGRGAVPEGPDPFPAASGVLASIPVLADAAGASGFINARPDRDGLLRRVPLLLRYDGGYHAGLGLATLMRAMGTDQLLVETTSGQPDAIRLGEKAIPVDLHGRMLVRFRGRGGHFTTVSGGDFLEGRVPPGQVNGRIVFVGTSAAGLKELRATPLDPVFPGVEVHATVVDNILAGDFLRAPHWASGVSLLLVMVLGLLSTWLLCRARALLSLLILTASLALLAMGTVHLFQGPGLFVSPSFPAITLISNFSWLTFLKFRREERTLRQRSEELLLTQDATIASMAALVEQRDTETGGHIERTRDYVKMLAEELRQKKEYAAYLDDLTIDNLHKSTPLHDIGKVGVPDHILCKKGALTKEEFEEMKNHTVYGYRVIRTAMEKLGENSFLKVAGEIALTHHEKWDGSGYPHGLCEDAIPLPGRLMALADVYDALISQRVYKDAFTHERAAEIIREGRGSHFDPAVVDAFLSIEEKFCRTAEEYLDSPGKSTKLCSLHNRPNGS